MTTTSAPASTIRYIGKCPTCSAIFSELSSTRPDRYGFGRSQNCTNAGCGRMLRFKAVKGTYNEAITCDARCTGAEGVKCSCSCGGALHGADHAA